MALGMEMTGTLEYTSPDEPVPLTLEEALLLVARRAHRAEPWRHRSLPGRRRPGAVGEPPPGRASAPTHGTELLFTDDDGLYFLRHAGPHAGSAEGLDTLAGKPLDGQVDCMLLVRRAEVELRPGQAQMPTGLPGSSSSTPGTRPDHALLPVSSMTLE